MTRAFEMLSPSANVGMLDRATLFVAGADQILATGVNSGFGSHAPDQGDLVRMIGQVRHRPTQLEAGLGRYGRFGALRFPLLRIESIDVGHPTDHLKENHVLGFAETGTSQPFSRGQLAGSPGQNGYAEGGLGPAFTKGAPGDRIELMREVHDDSSYSTKTNSRELNITQVRSPRVRPPLKPATEFVSSSGLGLRLKKLEVETLNLLSRAGLTRRSLDGQRIWLTDDPLRFTIHQHKDLGNASFFTAAVRDLAVALTEHAEKVLVPFRLR